MYVQLYDDDTSIADIKTELERLEGIPFEQLVLIHAGEELTNDINLRRHGLCDFNQSNEVFIDLQARYCSACIPANMCAGGAAISTSLQRSRVAESIDVCQSYQCLHQYARASRIQVVMQDAKHVYLTAPACRGSLICERIERAAPLSDILALLEAHGLVAAMSRHAAVVAKCAVDAATIGGVAVVLSDSIEDVESKVGRALVRIHYATLMILAGASAFSRALDQVLMRCSCAAALLYHGSR